MWYWFGTIPKKFGHRIRKGYYYDTYHNKNTGKFSVLELHSGRFFERE